MTTIHPDYIRAALRALAARLAPHRFDLSDEKRLQEELQGVLEGFLPAVDRECRLAPGSVIDFRVIWPTGDETHLRLGIEVKRRVRAKAAARRQFARYCETGAIDGLLIVSATAFDLPREIGGVPVHALSLGRAWL